MKQLALFLLCIGSTLVASSFQQEFLNEVMAMAAQNSEEVMSDERALIERFYEESKQESHGSDAEIRPVYVSVQGDFERTMAYMLEQGRIVGLLGWIHTPAPPTPLCTHGDISPGLVDDGIAHDPRRLYTVMKRPKIIRDFLSKGGFIAAMYPECGLSKRSEEQLAVFNEVKEQFPNQLIDLPLSISELSDDMIGATYCFKTLEEEWFVFAIQATQANAPEDDRTWIMWFGPTSDVEVGRRISRVSRAIQHPVVSSDDLPLGGHSK